MTDIPPTSVVVQPIIHYKSMTGSTKNNFFNPTSVYNQREFVMRTNVEYLLIVDPPLENDQLKEALLVHPGHLINPPEGTIVCQENTEPQVICLRVKHNIAQMTLLVPVRTPLSFLLCSAKLQIEMFTIPLAQAKQCMKALRDNYLLVDLPPVNAPHRLVMFDDQPTFPPRTTPYTLPYCKSTAADIPPPVRPHNLLLRRAYERPGFIQY